MTQALRVLHLEDDPQDAELVEMELHDGGIVCDIVCADSGEVFERAVASGTFDFVILDHEVPGYSGMQALTLTRKLLPDVPIIMVSGALREEEGVECLKAGADDYILKHRLQRLVPAVRTVLANAENRRLRADAQRALRQSEQRLALALDASGLAVWEWDISSGQVSFSDHWWGILGYEAGEVALHVDAWERLTHFADLEWVKTVLAAHFRSETPLLDVEYRMRSKSGEWRWIRSVGRVSQRDGNGRAVRMTGTHGDVTLRKQHEAKIDSLSRIHVLMSRINSLILRAQRRQEVLQEACEIAVGAGDFIMSWVAIIDPATQQITVAARAGHDDGYVDKILRVLGDRVREGQGLVARTMRIGAPATIGDFETADPRAFDRGSALAHGYRSCISLPLTVDKHIVGAFCIYSGTPHAFDDEEVKLLSGLAADISFALDYIGKRERLDYLAYYDPLTGLPNGRLFIDRCEQSLRHAGDSGSVAVIVLDIERFRHVNETLGRDAGDSLLQTFAERLQLALVNAHAVARIASNCFAIVHEGIRSAADAVRLYNQAIVPRIGDPITFQGNEYRLAVRAGIAFAPKDGHDAETLLRNAESALNRAKGIGDPYAFYRPEMNAAAGERLTLESKLHNALEDGRFVLHYQPKYSLRTGALTGLEALLRLVDPQKGLVAPDQFIPILEETGLIREVGLWALGQAASDLRTWAAAGLAPPRVAVNVSAVQLRQADFADRIRDAVGGDAGSGMPPGCGLDLEITESVIMRDVESHIALLEQIRRMGMRIYIDDFGTGYSSLRYIARLPINALKIDHSFIAHIIDSAEDRAIVSSIISLAHSMQLSVVAEGVENADQQRLLGALQCDEVQGYFLCVPVTAEEISRLCARVAGN